MNTSKNVMVDRVFTPRASFARLLLPIICAVANLTACSKAVTTMLDCRDHIKETLKDPESAEFSDGNYMVWKDTGKVASVTWKTRATNSYGAYLTKSLTCEYDHQGHFLLVD